MPDNSHSHKIESSERTQQLQELSDRLGLGIRNLDLLDRALTHASMLAETPAPAHDYEALEFLGDAVLGLAVGHYLYANAPDLPPGEYSRMRAGLVNRRALARMAAAIDIGPAIRLGKGEELAGGRQRTALLADCLEALTGALYLDQGWETTRQFIVRIFGEELQRVLVSEKAWDYKSRLQNYCQGRHLPLPVFEVVRSEGPDHKKQFEVEVSVHGEPAGRGRGSTKKEAEQNAAHAALRREGQILD